MSKRLSTIPSAGELDSTTRALHRELLAIEHEHGGEGSPFDEMSHEQLDMLQRLSRAALSIQTISGNALEARIADLELALDLAVLTLGEQEPGDSRAVSNEFVAMFAIQCGQTEHLEECRDIIRAALVDQG